jgi:16S rRNA (guanine966-N2)-methyltransferase
MRIISGSHKGRRIIAPKSLPVRPTTDRAKEALFNILQHRIDLYEVKALDLFSGIGSISFELSSRGCPDITSVDKHFGCIRFISETTEKLGLDGIHTVKSDVFQYLDRTSARFDFIFADPPYDLLKVMCWPKKF